MRKTHWKTGRKKRKKDKTYIYVVAFFKELIVTCNRKCINNHDKRHGINMEVLQPDLLLFLRQIRKIFIIPNSYTDYMKIGIRDNWKNTS